MPIHDALNDYLPARDPARGIPISPPQATLLGTSPQFDRHAATRAAQLRTVLDRTVGAAFGVDPTLMGQSSRGRAEVARARQVAMYLAHVMCGLSLTNVGELYERDRTTVAHACQIVEDLREAGHFDQAIQHLECALAIMLQASELSEMTHAARRLM